MSAESVPAAPERVLHATATHVGLVRSINEDAAVAAPPLFAVADGMGGHAGGDVASRLVVEELGRCSGHPWTPDSAREAVVAALVRAQARLRSWAEQQPADSKVWYAGTTVVAAVLCHAPGAVDGEGVAGWRWLVANVGDSRAYAVAASGVHPVTTDHSVVQELVTAGHLTPEQAAVHPERHVITRALSSLDVPEPDFFELDVAQAPRLLLCTDGVSGLVPETLLAGLVADPAATPRAVVDGLVAAALAGGGTDNATALVVDVVG